MGIFSRGTMLFGAFFAALLMLFAALMTASEPSKADVQVTIAQLEQFLASERAVHAADEDIAPHLLAAELTERLSQPALAGIKLKFSPGKHTAQALDLLADRSEFLDLPAGELPQKNAPSADAQQRMIRSAVSFATDTLNHLPDYLATETTKSFEDIPLLTKTTSMQSGLYPTGTSVHEVAYRNGREVSSRALKPAGGHAAPFLGVHMESLGQFGPVLETIMTDSGKGSIRWGHWEQTSAGMLAVFAYDVPKTASHYRVDFCCASYSVEGSEVEYHGTPAYHGRLSIDPATGAILRVTLRAEFPEFDPQPHVDLMVEYRKVDVSGSGLMCPVRSVAISEAYTWDGKRYWTNFFLNEMTYSNYRRFGSTSRILENAAK